MIVKGVTIITVLLGLAFLPIASMPAIMAQLKQAPFVVQVPQDFSKIQAAINAVAEGGMVLIAPGVYRETLYIDKSVRLIGARRDQVQLVGEHRDQEAIIRVVSYHRPIQVFFEGFTVGDLQSVAVSSRTGVYINGAVQTTLKNLDIHTEAQGIYVVSDVSHVILSEANIENNEVGVLLGEGHVVVQGSMIKGNLIGILTLYARGSFRLSHSVLLKNRSAAVIVRQGADPIHAAIIDNQFIGNGTGIYLGTAERESTINISRNFLVENVNYGIALLQEECASDDPFVKLFTISQSQPTTLVRGESNQFRDNGKADLCPADYPWPPGFRK